MNQQKMLRGFYIIGAMVFLLIGIFNTITIISTWKTLILSVKFSNILGNFFNYVLSYVFAYMFVDAKPVIQLNEQELDKIIQEAK